MVYKNKLISVLLLAFLVLLVFAAADPTGPDTITVESNQSKTTSTSGTMINISGGYIAKLNLTLLAQNTHWKAFVGDVTGAFTLDDASGSTIYNWSSGSTTGRVYATRESGPITWTSPACATGVQVTTEENALLHTGSDNISSTFTKQADNDFVVAGTTLSNCLSQNTFVNNASQDTTFEEIIMHDGSNILYATFINSTTGYDGGMYDFQMIVPENASSAAPQLPYYLFVELD